MITYYLNKNKLLVNTVKTSTFQSENIVDKIRFVFPRFYEDLDLRECQFLLRYMTLDNVLHVEELTIYNEEYKEDFIELRLAVKSLMTEFADDVKFRIIVKKGTDSGNVPRLITSEAVLTVLPVDARYILSPASDDITTQIPDGIALTSTKDGIQLTANGKAVGDPIPLKDIHENTDDVVDNEMFNIGEL